MPLLTFIAPRPGLGRSEERRPIAASANCWNVRTARPIVCNVICEGCSGALSRSRRDRTLTLEYSTSGETIRKGCASICGRPPTKPWMPPEQPVSTAKRLRYSPPIDKTPSSSRSSVLTAIQKQMAKRLKVVVANELDACKRFPTETCLQRRTAAARALGAYEAA